MKRLIILLLCITLISADTVVTSGLTQAQRDAILNRHNELRQLVASGGQSGQPGASNMETMVYNTDVEIIANNYIQQCSTSHNANRSSGSLKVGENIYWKGGSGASTITSEALVAAVDSWFSEVLDFDPSFISSFTSSPAGHYTQVVWHDSTNLGCSAAICQDNSSQKWLLIICDYNPPGNWLGQPIYKTCTTNCGSKNSITTTPTPTPSPVKSSQPVVTPIKQSTPTPDPIPAPIIPIPSKSTNPTPIVSIISAPVQQSSQTINTIIPPKTDPKTQNGITQSSATQSTTNLISSKSTQNNNQGIQPTVSKTTNDNIDYNFNNYDEISQDEQNYDENYGDEQYYDEIVNDELTQSTYVEGGMTRALRNAVLKIHNIKRKFVGQGYQRGQPSATDILPMDYDNDLEAIAQDQSQKCVSSHNPEIKKGNLEIGENLFQSDQSRSQSISVDVVNLAMEYWYGEVYNFDSSQLASYVFDSQTEQYTQMIWHDTTQIGCGVSVCANKQNQKWISVVCNYSPPGNQFGQPVYSASVSSNKNKDKKNTNKPSNSRTSSDGNWGTNGNWGKRDNEVSTDQSSNDTSWLTNDICQTDTDCGQGICIKNKLNHLVCDCSTTKFVGNQCQNNLNEQDTVEQLIDDAFTAIEVLTVDQADDKVNLILNLQQYLLDMNLDQRIQAIKYLSTGLEISNTLVQMDQLFDLISKLQERSEFDLQPSVQEQAAIVFLQIKYAKQVGKVLEKGKLNQKPGKGVLAISVNFVPTGDDQGNTILMNQRIVIGDKKHLPPVLSIPDKIQKQIKLITVVLRDPQPFLATVPQQISSPLIAIFLYDEHNEIIQLSKDDPIIFSVDVDKKQTNNPILAHYDEAKMRFIKDQNTFTCPSRQDQCFAEVLNLDLFTTLPVDDAVIQSPNEEEGRESQTATSPGLLELQIAHSYLLESFILIIVLQMII